MSLSTRFALSEKGRRNLTKASVAAFVTDIVLMLQMMLVIAFVSDIVGDNEYDFDLPLWIYIAVGLALMALTAAAYIYQFDRCFADTYKESRDVRIRLAETIRKLPLSFFSRKDPTEITVTMMGDVTMQEEALSHWLPPLISSLVFTPMIAVMILVWSPVIGIAMVWPVPAAFALILLSSRVVRRENRIKFERTERVTEMIQESIECSKDLKANDAQRAYLDRLDAEMDRVESAEVRCELASSISVAAAQMVLRLGIATTAIAGAWMLSEGTLSLISYIIALIMVGRIYGPIDSSIINLESVYTAEDHCARIRDMEEQPLQTGSEYFTPDGYDIVFRDVGFSYNDGDAVLDGVSFEARQGEVTALVGPSGGGKSTVARLAVRFWDPESGSVSLGGVDISTVDPETLMSRYSIVFQDVVLFNTSVMDNIRIGRKGATDEEVLAAAKAAMCDEFVSALPDGYSTVIGENGDRLSGGERQRISIARAILKDAPVIIMDEATASLDTESESRVQEALSRLIAGKTVLIIAHRMRTVEDADRIVVLSGGRVAESGSPKELMSRGGIFARMVELQTGSDSWSL